MPTENNPFGVTAPFDSWEAVWANADITSCKATRHGTVTTALQEHAIVTSLAAYRGDRDFALEGLHIQCAITDNGYLGINPLTGMQVDEVRGMLVLCPHRPGADDLREALPAS